jgi:hypothetical protein
MSASSPRRVKNPVNNPNVRRPGLSSRVDHSVKVLLRCHPADNRPFFLSLTWGQALDIRPHRRYLPESSPIEGTSTGDSDRWGGCGSCGWACNPSPGGPGIALAGITTGLRGAPLDWDSARRVTPARGTSQETRPGLSHGINLRGKCRGGAPKGERARSVDEWQHSLTWRAPHPSMRLWTTRLSALCLPSF